MVTKYLAMKVLKTLRVGVSRSTKSLRIINLNSCNKVKNYLSQKVKSDEMLSTVGFGYD